MRSVFFPFFVLIACVTTSPLDAASSTCDATDANSMLQARSLVREHQEQNKIQPLPAVALQSKRMTIQSYTPFLDAAADDLRSLAESALALAREAKTAAAAAVDPDSVDGVDTETAHNIARLALLTAAEAQQSLLQAWRAWAPGAETSTALLLQVHCDLFDFDCHARETANDVVQVVSTVANEIETVVQDVITFVEPLPIVGGVLGATLGIMFVGSSGALAGGLAGAAAGGLGASLLGTPLMGPIGALGGAIVGAVIGAGGGAVLGTIGGVAIELLIDHLSHPAERVPVQAITCEIDDLRFALGQGFSCVGEGFCRTAGGGSGNSVFRRSDSIEQCMALCNDDSNCIAIEYQQGDRHCELHSEAIATVAPDPRGRCFNKLPPVVDHFDLVGFGLCRDAQGGSGTQVTHEVNNLGQCMILCHFDSTCRAIEYQRERRQCEVHRTAMPNFRHEADARCFNKIGGSSSGGAHLGVAASNLCSTESMSEAECLSAAQALLPAGQRQGRQHLVAGNWNHVPPGCSLQSTGDWAAHYNRRASGSNSGGYTPVCSGGGTAPFHFPQIEIELPPLSRTQASQLPQTWDASDVRFDIETVVEPPAVVTSVIVSSDWWMKRPKDLQIFLVDSNSIATPVATVEYPTSLDICGTNGDEECSYPNTPTSMLTIDVDSHIVASTVRVAVLTPRNAPGTGNDQVMIKEVAVVTVGGGCLGTYEAESATIVGGIVHANTASAAHAGFTGDSFVDYLHPTGDYVEWSVPSCSRGSVTASFRYALGSGNRPMQVLVNGHEVESALSFPGTGSWASWSEASMTVELNEGSNVVRLAASGRSGANMDSLIISEAVHLGVAASDSCSTESVSMDNCLQAVRVLLPEGAEQSNPTLNSGSWNHVPPGCSMNHGNYRALWNRRATGSNTGSWTPVCTGPPAVVMVDGCPNQNTEVPRAAVSRDSAATASVRCCSHSSPTTCVTNLPGGCQNGKTFLEAVEICELNGQRLCTEDEMSVDRLCCGTGCGFDGHQIWVGR